MINKKLVKTILNGSSNECKIIIIEELFNHISMNYDYNDQKANHLLEMLVDKTCVVRSGDINLDYIRANPNLLMYKHEEYNISDINVVNIDNIECNVKISFKYLEKINEDRDDVSYTDSYTNISYIDYPNILKNTVK